MHKEGTNWPLFLNRNLKEKDHFTRIYIVFFYFLLGVRPDVRIWQAGIVRNIAEIYFFIYIYFVSYNFDWLVSLGIKIISLHR